MEEWEEEVLRKTEGPRKPHSHTKTNKQTKILIESSNLGSQGLIEIEPLTKEHTGESYPFMKRKDEWMVGRRREVWRRGWKKRGVETVIRVENFIN